MVNAQESCLDKLDAQRVSYAKAYLSKTQSFRHNP